MLLASFDYSEVNNADVIMIAVPTPLDRYQQPDYSYVRASVKSLAENVSENTLVILESTTYPGTTEEILLQDFKTANTPKVVGGVTENCNKISKAFYEEILDDPFHLVSSPAVAEMEKIYENTFRNINIALANEMTILCNRMGIDIWEVIEAAKTKPYGFMAFYPGPGIGGHCIPLDPFYLTRKAREYGYHTRLIELAGEINNHMPEFVVYKLSKLLNKKGLALSKSKILILGAAYKKDISDVRESPVQQLIVELEKDEVKFDYNDPYVPSFHNELNDKIYNSVSLDNLEDYDAVVIAVDHSIYDYQDIVKRAKLVFDTRFACKNIKSNKIVRL